MTYGRVRLTTRGRGNCFDTMAEEGGVGDEEEQPPEEAEDDGAEFFESSAVCVVPIEVPTDEECLALWLWQRQLQRRKAQWGLEGLAAAASAASF